MSESRDPMDRPPLPSEPAPEAPDAMPDATSAPVAAAAIRFCRACGEPWQAEWADCPRCAEHAANRTARATSSTSYAHDIRFVKSSVGLYFALLAVSIVTLIVAVAGEEGSEGRLGPTAEIVATVAFALITAAWCFASRRELAPLLRRGAAIGWYAVAVLIACGTFAVAVGVVKLLTAGLGMEDLRYTDDLLAAGYGMWVVILLICVEPGVFEELGFRGVIQTSLQRVLGAREALLVSAFMFALLHLSIPSMPHLFLIGVALGWLRNRTGSLYPGMLLHFSHNLLVVVLERWEGAAAW